MLYLLQPHGAQLPWHRLGATYTSMEANALPQLKYHIGARRAKDGTLVCYETEDWNGGVGPRARKKSDGDETKTLREKEFTQFQ